MLYQLEMGSLEEGIVKQAIRNRTPIPEKILESPELRQDLQFYFNAFLELDCERDFGFQISPIKWSAIKKYCEYCNLDEEEQELMFFFIRKMDNVRMKEIQKKESK